MKKFLAILLLCSILIPYKTLGNELQSNRIKPIIIKYTDDLKNIDINQLINDESIISAKLIGSDRNIKKAFIEVKTKNTTETIEVPIIYKARSAKESIYSTLFIMFCIVSTVFCCVILHYILY